MRKRKINPGRGKAEELHLTTFLFSTLKHVKVGNCLIQSGNDFQLIFYCSDGVENCATFVVFLLTNNFNRTLC